MLQSITEFKLQNESPHNELNGPCQVGVNPVAPDRWPVMFEGVRENLKLTKTRTLDIGKIFLCYEPLV